MINRRIIIFIFPVFLVLYSIPGLFGYYTFYKIPEKDVTHRLTKLTDELENANAPLSKEHMDYIVASLKAEKAEIQLQETILQNLKQNYKSLIKAILIVLCIQIVIAGYLVKHIQFTRHKLK